MEQKQLGLWIAVGAGVGVAVGAAMDNIALWLAVGIGLGVAMGSVNGRMNQEDE